MGPIVLMLKDFYNDTKRSELLPIKMMFASLMTAVYSLYPYMTLHLKSQGITPSEIALIYSIIPVFTFLSPPLVGFCIDKFGNIKVVYCVICLFCAIFADSLMFVPNAIDHTSYNEQITLQLSCSRNDSQLKGLMFNITNPCNVIEENEIVGVNVSVTIAQCHQICAKGINNTISPCFRDRFNRCYTPNAIVWKLTQLKINKHSTPRDTIINGTEIHVKNIAIDNEIFNGFSCGRANAQCWSYCVGQIPGSKICKDKKINNPMSFWINLVLRTIQSICSTSAYVLFEAMTLESLKKYKADYGHQKLWGHIIACIITPVTGLLIDYKSEGKSQTDYTVAFYIYTASRLSSFLIMPFLTVDFKMPQQTHLKDVKTLIKNNEFRFFIGIVFITGALWGYLEGFIFLFLKELNSPQVVMGLTVTAGAVAGLPMLICSGTLIAKIGHVNVLALSLFVYCIRFLGYSLIWDPYLCLIFESLEAFTSVLHMVAAATYAAKLAPPGILASAQGLFIGVHYGIGRGAGSLVGGYLMGYLGSRASFQILSGISGTAAIFYLVSYHLWFKKRFNSLKIKQKLSVDYTANGNLSHRIDIPKNVITTSQTNHELQTGEVLKFEEHIIAKDETKYRISNGGKCNTGYQDDEVKTDIKLKTILN